MYQKNVHGSQEVTQAILDTSLLELKINGETTFYIANNGLTKLLKKKLGDAQRKGRLATGYDILDIFQLIQGGSSEIVNPNEFEEIKSKLNLKQSIVSLGIDNWVFYTRGGSL